VGRLSLSENIYCTFAPNLFFGIKIEMTDYLKNTTETLQKLKPTLANLYNVNTIGLFGSIVRDDFIPETSDVDIVVNFIQPIGIEFVDLSFLLEKELNRKIDLVSLNGIKSKYFQEIEKDIIYV
jgi:predicted nucleotidyltransferase